MRPAHAVLVCVAASALGALTGTYDLPATSPDRSAPSPSPTSPSAVSPATPTLVPTSPAPSTTPSASPSPSSSAPPSPSPTPTARLTSADLLSVRSFADVSVPVDVEPQHGAADRDVDATACVSDDVHQTSTLKDLTGYDPVLEGDWTRTDDGEGARQLVAVTPDTAGAQESVRRVLVAMESCQEAPPGHVVVGMATSVTYSPTRSGSYVGLFTEKQNRTGRAPDDAEPCGGTVVARNGARFTVVNVYMCLDASQLAGLADAASERLG